jgi:exodeoxyribonuclease VII large subunit
MALKKYPMTARARSAPLSLLDPIEINVGAANASAAETTYTVTSLTKAVRNVLEPAFAEVTVEGEISNFIHHGSGHRYWTLKDAGAQISSVFWKSRITNFDLRDGMKVVCRGRLTIYPPRGQYQLDVFQVRPSGIGELQRAYEELYARLLAEGLFDEGRKRSIPKFPRTIGIITSETGAALQDMLTVLRRRYPIVRVVLRPAAVQGVGAELEIARAIQEFNISGTPSPRPDVLIVGRGCGSLEDLWSFNEEAVARAIFASKIPVISAVGHEVDFTIADFVADLRAPTPTAAAELATPNVEELMSIVRTQRTALVRRMRQEIAERRRYVEQASDGRSLVVAISNTIHTRREQLNGEVLSVSRSVVHSLERMRLKLERDTAKLAVLHPDRVLDRGYTALESLDGEIIPKLSALLERGDKNGVLMFADGRITVRFD